MDVVIVVVAIVLIVNCLRFLSRPLHRTVLLFRS